jgi:hypothetical protein
MWASTVGGAEGRCPDARKFQVVNGSRLGGMTKRVMPRRDSNPGYLELLSDELKTKGANRYTTWQMLLYWWSDNLISANYYLAAPEPGRRLSAPLDWSSVTRATKIIADHSS